MPSRSVTTSRVACGKSACELHGARHGRQRVPELVQDRRKHLADRRELEQPVPVLVEPLVVVDVLKDDRHGARPGGLRRERSELNAQLPTRFAASADPDRRAQIVLLGLCDDSLELGERSEYAVEGVPDQRADLLTEDPAGATVRITDAAGSIRDDLRCRLLVEDLRAGPAVTAAGAHRRRLLERAQKAELILQCIGT